MSIEAMKQALEALESATPKYTRQRADQKTLGGALDYWKLEQHQRLKAITSLRQAIAEAEKHEVSQEPVAWEVFALKFAKGTKLQYGKPKNLPKYVSCRPLYTHPQPKREPPKAGDGHDLFYEAVRLLDNAIFAQSGDVVRHDLAAHKEALDFFNHVFTKLDLTPSQPKREPVALRSEQFVDMARAIAPRTVMGMKEQIPNWIVEFGRAIEAAHGIKGETCQQ